MKEYIFFYYKYKEQKKGILKISRPIKDNSCGDYFVEIYCSIDDRTHKIYGINQKHVMELAYIFFMERYKRYSPKNINGVAFSF